VPREPSKKVDSTAIAQEEPLLMEPSHIFEGFTHIALCELVEQKLDEMCNRMIELNRSVLYSFSSPFKREDDIRVKNLCRKWRVRCESNEDSTTIKKKKEKKRETIRITAVLGTSRKPGQDEDQQIVSDSESDSDECLIPSNRVTFVKKTKEDFVDVHGMSDSEFLRFVESTLRQLVDDTDAEEKTVLIFNFPPMDSHRSEKLIAVCHRCSIRVEILQERKLQTRSAKKQKLLKMGMGNPEVPISIKQGAVKGTIVQVMVTNGVSIRPHRQLIRAVLEIEEISTRGESPQHKKERRKSFSKKQKIITEAVNKVLLV
jgi:Icc-related predicted phosphoesterase